MWRVGVVMTVLLRVWGSGRGLWEVRSEICRWCLRAVRSRCWSERRSFSRGGGSGPLAAPCVDLGLFLGGYAEGLDHHVVRVPGGFVVFAGGWVPLLVDEVLDPV